MSYADGKQYWAEAGTVSGVQFHNPRTKFNRSIPARVASVVEAKGNVVMKYWYLVLPRCNLTNCTTLSTMWQSWGGVLSISIAIVYYIHGPLSWLMMCWFFSFILFLFCLLIVTFEKNWLLVFRFFDFHCNLSSFFAISNKTS